MTPKATSTFTQRQPARELVILTQQLRCELPRLFRADTLALLLHGSWALGLATPISDVDVLRIVDPAVSTRKNPEIISVGGRYVHVDIGTFDALRPERLEEVLGKQIFDTNDITTRLSTAIVLAEQERAGRLLVDEFRSWSPPRPCDARSSSKRLGS